MIKTSPRFHIPCVYMRVHVRAHRYEHREPMRVNLRTRTASDPCLYPHSLSRRSVRSTEQNPLLERAPLGAVLLSVTEPQTEQRGSGWARSAGRIIPKTTKTQDSERIKIFVT